MIEIIWDDKFRKKFKKWYMKHPELLERFDERIHLFEREPFAPSLKTHSLIGSLKGYWAISITYEQRLVFQFDDDNKKAILANIGTHDEVY